MSLPNLTSSPLEVRLLGKEIIKGRRIGLDDAMLLWDRADLLDLGAMAHAVRLKKHPDNLVTYVVDRNINYSNICVCACRFCAFFRPPDDPEGYVLTREQLAAKVDETLAAGGNQILMQGGHHPGLPLAYYEEMLRFLREKYPALHIHAFSPPEIVFFAGLEGIPVAEVVRRLREAGLNSIPGGGAEILVDAVRSQVSPNKCPAGQWLDVMRQAHLQGMRTTATMMFGHEETVGQRMEHLLAVRGLQDESLSNSTGGFTAFIPWSFQPANTRIQARPATAQEYLRMLAISRLVLDNVDNIQVSWVTMGGQVAQLALFFGGNDFGSTMLEENVVAAAGVSFRLPESEIRRLARAAGFVPARRRMDYSLLEDPA